jgi:hypothetical protein
MDFDEYFKKMCGNSSDTESSSFDLTSKNTPFNKKELRWLKEHLETCIEWDDDSTTRSKQINYKKMLDKVEERLLNL